MKTILPLASLFGLAIINIGVWNKRMHRYDNMLITLDTGASVTTISTDILQRLGYDTALLNAIFPEVFVPPVFLFVCYRTDIKSNRNLKNEKIM